MEINSQTYLEQLRWGALRNYKKVMALFVFAFAFSSMNASTIHWITFIDTDDRNVGELDKNARNILYERFIKVVNNELGQYGYDYKIYDYYSGNYTPQDCQNCIKNLRCDTTDIVIFYHIGHGSRISKDIEHVKYPLMLIDNEIRHGIPLSWVHKSLKEKNARLTFTISIASNRYVEIGVDTDIAEVILPSIQNCEELRDADNQYKSVIANAFLGYKGDLIVCSASPEQDSWAAQTPFGSMDVFTYVFVSTFEGVIFDKSFTWPRFLTKLSETTTEVTRDMPTQGVQTPIYDYNLKRIREKDR
jgi:hypothetical protein